MADVAKRKRATELVFVAVLLVSFEVHFRDLFFPVRPKQINDTPTRRVGFLDKFGSCPF